MHDLLRFVNENDGRVILSGDTRQHGAVEATDALRAIEK
ncbi:MAG: AAA family ATPase [Verrucomicrobiales bacterium]|nr:AAA family ATPase [Verrucomicrobiales bacterium]